jgi:hypothetical protein
MNSLLAHLYSRIKGSPEDIATMSLCYVLESSESAKQVFCNYLSSVSGIESFPDLNFKTQVSGENNERPDLVGSDRNNDEVLLCEAKFWAGLTKNQPLAYLERLRKSESSMEKALVFICPESRIISLWGELTRIINGSDAVKSDESQELKRVKVGGILMKIVSWREIVNIIMQALSAEHSTMVADVQQLQGLCERMDEEAFLPLTHEDFGVDKAKRIMSFYNIVDKVTDELINNMGASPKGFKKTYQYAGVDRYLRLGDFGISIRFSCNHWAKFAETPFWLTIKAIENNEWVYAKKAREKLKSYENDIPKKLYINETWQELVIPLYVPAYAYEDEVVNAMLGTVKDVFTILGYEQIGKK